MKNGDLPAMPIHLTEAIIRAAENGADEIVNRVSGLTKREQFAAMAMQGILAKHGDDDYQREQIASYAVAHADALLKELERTK